MLTRGLRSGKPSFEWILNRRVCSRLEIVLFWQPPLGKIYGEHSWDIEAKHQLASCAGDPGMVIGIATRSLRFTSAGTYEVDMQTQAPFREENRAERRLAALNAESRIGSPPGGNCGHTVRLRGEPEGAAVGLACLQP